MLRTPNADNAMGMLSSLRPTFPEPGWQSRASAVTVVTVFAEDLKPTRTKT